MHNPAYTGVVKVTGTGKPDAADDGKSAPVHTLWYVVVGVVP
jgi:hypothetical protein